MGCRCGCLSGARCRQLYYLHINSVTYTLFFIPDCQFWKCIFYVSLGNIFLLFFCGGPWATAQFAPPPQIQPWVHYVKKLCWAKSLVCSSSSCEQVHHFMFCRYAGSLPCCQKNRCGNENSLWVLVISTIILLCLVDDLSLTFLSWTPGCYRDCVGTVTPLMRTPGHVLPIC